MIYIQIRFCNLAILSTKIKKRQKRSVILLKHTESLEVGVVGDGGGSTPDFLTTFLGVEIALSSLPWF